MTSMMPVHSANRAISDASSGLKPAVRRTSRVTSVGRIARGTAAEAFEAGQKERIVISEFPSMEKAIAAYRSPAYQEALKALGDGAVRDIRIVEALD